VGAALRVSGDRVHMRDALRSALGDARTDLLFRDRAVDGWRDAGGHPVQGPRELATDRAVTAIDTGDGRHDIALVHDVALLDDRELLDGISGMVLANWRHERLTANLGQAMTELEESRRRISEAADLERARIERDLHDGAQQHLVALSVLIRLARDADADRYHALLTEASCLVDNAVGEIRRLAQGIYPPLLVSGGLTQALPGLARHAVVPVHLDLQGVGRFSTSTEAALYYCCSEALQNAAKHGGPGTEVTVTARGDGQRLSVEISDSGHGFDPGTIGMGLTNMADRLSAIGGELSVDTAPGRGTRITATVDASPGT